MPCPFGFHGDNPHISESDADEHDATGAVKKVKVERNKIEMSHGVDGGEQSI